MPVLHLNRRSAGAVSQGSISGSAWCTSVTNVPHLIADILVPDARVDQIVLMLALVVFGLLINMEGRRWWRDEPAPNG